METSTHRGFQTMFIEGQFTLGIFAPIEAYEDSIPTMHDHLARIRQAERLGFAALWVRDVPLSDPSFADKSGG